MRRCALPWSQVHPGSLRRRCATWINCLLITVREETPRMIPTSSGRNAMGKVPNAVPASLRSVTDPAHLLYDRTFAVVASASTVGAYGQGTVVYRDGIPLKIPVEATSLHPASSCLPSSKLPQSIHSRAMLAGTSRVKSTALRTVLRETPGEIPWAYSPLYQGQGQTEIPLQSRR
jgi:hypothetical protein